MTTIATPQPPSVTTDWTEAVRTVGTELEPGVAERDRTGEVPAAGFERLRALGVTAALVPAELGGGGATHAEIGAALRALGALDPAAAVTLAMHTHLVAAQVWRHRHGMDASAVFGKVVGGAMLVSTGASDWVPSNGRAERVDGGYRVWARKAPASGCEIGDVVVTSIRWDDAPDGPQVLHCSLPLQADGVSIEHTWDTLGLRATGSHTVVLDGAFVPDAAVSLVRPADEWPPIWNVVIGAAMPLIMAAYVGIADATVRAATAAVAGRTDVHVLQLLGELANAHTTAVDVVDAMFREADDLRFDNTDALAARTLSRKTVATGAMLDVARLAVELVGGAGYSRGTEVERLVRDLQGAQFHPLPRAKQTQFTGRVIQGLPPVG
jgi:alkylation response protein AidB-like acyl-CoA dehydrogenase